MVVFEDDIATCIGEGARAGLPCASVRVTTSIPPAEVVIGVGCANILSASGEGPCTVTVPEPELKPEAEPVIVAVPGENPMSYAAEESTDPLAMVRLVEGSFTTLLFD